MEITTLSIKYCPLCGSETIVKVARRKDNNEPVFACFNCKGAFSAILMGKKVIKRE